MSAALVKELRQRTGLGLLECKRALKAADGDVDNAIEELRKSSGMKAAKKAGRTAADGIVAVRLSDDGSYGIILEVNSETDFVARDDNFLGFVDSVAEAAFAAKQTDVAVLMATDLEVGIRLEVAGVEIQTPGSAVLPVSRFGPLLRESSDEKLSIEADPQGTVVKGERSLFNFAYQGWGDVCMRAPSNPILYCHCRVERT